jgi:phage gp36-like protein
MPYATVTDLQDRLGEARLVQLTDRADPPLGLVDDGVAGKALDDASAEIDGYLIGRYTLPLADAPEILRVHCITIACYRLLGGAATETDREDYKATRDYLNRVADGRVNLLPPSQVPPPAGAGTVIFSPGAKVMGREEG